MSYNFEVEGTVRFPVGGKYCDRDIVVTAKGGGDTTVEDGFITKELTSIFNDRVTSVGEYTFYKFTKLQTVDLPNVTKVGNSAFWNAGLQSISMPLLRNVTGAQVFYACRSLISVNLPLLETTGGHMFYNCTALERVDFPLLHNIATSAFATDTKLSTVILRADTVCTLGNINAFTATPIANGMGYIYVPSALVDSYKAATNWATYAEQIKAIEDYPDITGG